MFNLPGIPWLKVGAIAGVLLAIWLGYKYITGLQEKVEFQAGEISKLELANKSLTDEREQLKLNLAKNQQDLTKLNEDLVKARTDKEKLIKLFSDHDFAELVKKKPGLIENKINKATEKVFKELEDISSE